MARTKGLYKRGNTWWLRYAGPDGRIHFESSRSASFKAAEVLLIQKKKEVLEGKKPLPTRRLAIHSFPELAEPYLGWAERQRAFKSKQGFVRQLGKTFGNYRLQSFTTRAVEGYQTKLLAEEKAPATINRHLATLKHMFTKAVEWEMVGEETLKRIRKVKQLPENNRRLRYLSTEECQTLIDTCYPHLKPIVITALNSGMRKQELLSLEWERHVDLKHGFILLDITKNGERREIPINQPLRDTLEGLVRRVNSPYVFTDSDGKRFQDVKTAFHSACRRAGIKDLRFHDLRHTFASHLVMQGVDLTSVKELLGHKTLTMTLRYAHLAPSHKVKAVALLEGIVGPKSSRQKVDNLTEMQVVDMR
jgi:integrase